MLSSLTTLLLGLIHLYLRPWQSRVRLAFLR